MLLKLVKDNYNILPMIVNRTDLKFSPESLLVFKKAVKYAVIILLSVVPAFVWCQKKQQEKQTTIDLIIDTTKKVDIIDVVKSNFEFNPKTLKRVPGKKVYFSLLPVSIPRGGKAVIASTSAGFYLGSRRSTFLSNVSFSPYLNFKGRYSLSFRSNLYTAKNMWNIQGDTRFSLYPEYIYGP